jgi:hypothetical protein
MGQCYVRLRGGIFAENGFNLHVHEIAPRGIKKSSSVYLSTMDVMHKTVNLEPLHGCEHIDEEIINIPLQPYPFPEKARKMLAVMCWCLQGALDGKHNERVMLGEAWQCMVVFGCGLLHQEHKTQIDLLSNLYGRGRVHDAMNQIAGLATLPEVDHALMVGEALGVRH